MEIIPAIDLINGQCVRLEKGDYSKKKMYSDNPVEIALSFEERGFTRLHLVDLDAAAGRESLNRKVLREIVQATSLEIDFGGGIRKDEDVEAIFDAGASMITAGSIATKNPDLVYKWLQDYGAEKIIIGADVRGVEVAVSGWKENSRINVYSLIKEYLVKGAKNFICTDISKDGMLKGPAFELYKDLLRRFPDMELIASGGVSCYQDIDALEKTGVTGVIVGKAFYENRI